MGIILAPSEAIIMKCLWDSKQDLTVVELVEKLREQYGKEYAVNTVSTFMTILMKKGFVTRYKTKHAHQYTPLISKEMYLNSQMNSVKEAWFEGSAYGMMASLVQMSDITSEEVHRLKELLDEYSN